MSEQRTVAEAMIEHYARVQECSDEYIECEVCDQSERVYRWSMYLTAIKLLATYYQLGANRKPVSSVATREAGHTGKGDENRLMMFGLLKKVAVVDSDGKATRSCYYQLTKKGLGFLFDKAPIPKAIWIFGDSVVKQTEETITLDELLAKGPKTFDLNEHLRSHK